MKLFILLLFLQICSIWALRFDMNPVTVDTEVILVGRPAKLTCNYAKFRTESIREITWYAGYTGIRTKIFGFSVTTGEKDGSVYPFIRTNEESATEKELTITLTEFRNGNMTFGCEIESLRDDGYGKLRHNKKLGQSHIKVIDNQAHQLTITPEQRTVSIGRPMQVKCVSTGADPAPMLTIKFADRNVSEIYGGRIASSEQRGGIALEARVDEVSEDLFNGRDFVEVECLAHYDDYLFGRKEMTIQRGNRDQYISPGVANYDRRGNWERDAEYRERTSTRRHSNDRDEMRGGRGHNHQDNSDGYEANVIHARLMDLVDPARHVHPGIPYDFFAGYVLMVTDSAVSGGGNADHVTLLGELPYDVETALSRNYGRVNQMGTGRLRVRMDAVKVMNIMGGLGYRVIGASSSGADAFVWTLERKNFETGGSGSGREL